ncbi:MAG: hypothetical protein R2853_15265 [Thermomicrobiales bacterium]
MGQAVAPLPHGNVRTWTVAETIVAANLDHDTDRLPSILPAAGGGRRSDFADRRITGLAGDAFLRRSDAGEIAEDGETLEGCGMMAPLKLSAFGCQTGVTGGRRLA